MDDFVRNKLTEWKLSEWIEAFEGKYYCELVMATVIDTYTFS